MLPVLSFGATPKPWKIFLLFGQSNMAGGAASEAQDKVTNPRVKVLAYDNCSAQGRSYDQWYTAAPSLHLCGTGVGLGDSFGRILADSLSSDTIALIPCAVPGVDISFFSKAVISSRRKEFSIPPDNHWSGAYPWMVERLKVAQQKGVISGILFHQGESDWADTSRQRWVGRVAAVVKDLKTDLGFADVPFLAGELRRDGCCVAHNPYVATLAKTVPNGQVISSQGLISSPSDAYHFTAAGYREFGKRYALAMAAALGKTMSTQPSLSKSPVGWSLVRGLGGADVAFDAAQDRIELRDLEGHLVAQGIGRSLAVPKTHRMLIVRAANATGQLSGVLPLAR